MTKQLDNSATSLSLLGRLREHPDDPMAWDEFVSRYGKMILHWCHQWGLQDADAHDVMQNVLLALSKQMRTFEYRPGGRFRSWLKTIAWRAWALYLDQRQRNAAGSGTGDSAIDRLLRSVEARDDFLYQLDQECRRNALQDAMTLVQQRVQSHTWEAFLRTALEDESGADVAASLDMSVVAVYRARSRVQAMIQEEVGHLDEFRD